METFVPIVRQPLGPAENISKGSWLDRRIRSVTSGLGIKEHVKKQLFIGTNSCDGFLEHEGELVQVAARVERIVRKPDVEVVLSFPVQGAAGTLQMFANCEVYAYDRRNKGEVLFRGEKVPVDDLERFILKDTAVMALVYWRASRVVTTGRRWRVAKLWKQDPNGDVDVFSVTSWTHVNLEEPPANDRSRSFHRGTSNVSFERISRSSSEPSKLVTSASNPANKYQIDRNKMQKKEENSDEDLKVRGRTFSWGTLLKERIGCNVKSNVPQSIQSSLTDYSVDGASGSLPSNSPLADESIHSIRTTPSLPVCLFAIPGVILEVKKATNGAEYVLSFARMGETREALMMKKYLSALTLDSVTETWTNVEEMLVPGLQVAIDVKNILFNKERKWLVFGLYLGKLTKNNGSHFIKDDASRKLKMELKDEVWEKEIITNKDSRAEIKQICAKKLEVSSVNRQLSVRQLQDEINERVKINSPAPTSIRNETNLQISTSYQANLNQADDEGYGDKTCTHKFDFSGAISETNSTSFTFIGPFGERWIKAELNIASTNLYVDGVRIQEAGEKLVFLKKSRGAMGNLVISKCLKCAHFNFSEDNDLLISEACLAWFGIDNAPWVQGDSGKVLSFSSIKEGTESLAVIRLSNSSSQVWYNTSQHNGPKLSTNSQVLVWAFRECTEAYYIGAAVVVPEKTQSQNSSCGRLDEPNPSAEGSRHLRSNEEEVFLDGNINNPRKLENPSEESLPGVISPLELNSSELFSFTPYEEIQSPNSLYASNDEEGKSSATRTKLRSLPSSTDSEYSEVDYRGTLAQIEAFKKLGSVEEEHVSSHLHAGFKTELDNGISASEMGGFEDEVFSKCQRTPPNVIITEVRHVPVDDGNKIDVDDSWKHEINGPFLRNDKMAKLMKTHDDFFKYAKLELSFGSLVRDNDMMNLPNPIIDTQFQMILFVNDLDSPQLIDSQAKTFDECFANGNWTRTDSVERVGRFTVFGKDSPEKNSTSLMIDQDIADEDMSWHRRELYLPTTENQKPSSLNVLPPILEEKETCSEAVSEDGSLSGTDGCEYSMSWTYTKVHDRTTSPTPGSKTSPITPGSKTTPITPGAKTTSPITPGSKTTSPIQICGKTPPSTNLLRYTSTPHLNKEEQVLERKFSVDSSSSLVHSFAACDTDSGLGESKSKLATIETSLLSLDDQGKSTKVMFEEKKNDMETDFTKKPCFWHTLTPTDTTEPIENSKDLIKGNLLEFLNFTEFPEDHRNELVEKFMKSGKAIL